MAASSSMGVSRLFAVTPSSSLRPVLMKPVFSATPTPSSATSTTPRGGNPVNVGTRLTMNSVSAVPVNWFATRSGSPVRGCVSVNATGASSADATHVSSRRRRNRIAGSGSRLPTVSTLLRKRSMALPRPVLSGRSSRSVCVFVMRSTSVSSGLTPFRCRISVVCNRILQLTLTQPTNTGRAWGVVGPSCRFRGKFQTQDSLRVPCYSSIAQETSQPCDWTDSSRREPTRP